MLTKKQSKLMFWVSVLLAFFVMVLAVPTQSVKAVAFPGGNSGSSPLTHHIYKAKGINAANPQILPGSVPTSDGGSSWPKVIAAMPSSDGKVHAFLEPHYTFVPQVSTATKVTTSNHGWKTNLIWGENTTGVNTGQNYNTPYVGFDARESTQHKGNLWIKYSHVGETASGDSIDLKITINNWKNHFQHSGLDTISFRKDRIALSTRGYESVDMTWEFLKSGTNNKVNVSGYFTFGDIDLSQGIRFSKPTSDAIDAVLVDKSVADGTSRLRFANQSGKYYIFDDVSASEVANGRDYDSPDDVKDRPYEFSILYSNQSSLRFEWITDFSRRAKPILPTQNYYFRDGNYTMGQYMFYEIEKPIPTLPPAPVKKAVSLDPGKNEMKYTITHTVPQEDPSSYAYNTYVMHDITRPGLKNPKITKVTNNKGQDVSHHFLINNYGTTAEAIAKAAFLKDVNFYGKTYTAHVTTNVDYDYVNSVAGSSFEFKNDTILGGPQGNTITDGAGVLLPKENVTIRHINQDNNEVLETETLDMMEGTPSISRSATWHGKTYGHKGRLSFVRSVVNGVNKGPESPVSTAVGSNGATIDFYYRSPFKFTHRHYDDDTSTHLVTYPDVNEYWKDSTWTEHENLKTPYNTFTDNGYKYPYYPVDAGKPGQTPQSGTTDFQTTNKKNYEYFVDFRHTKPNIDVAIDRVRIKTDDNDEGLPIRVDFNMLSIDEANWGEDRWVTSMLRVKVIDKTAGAGNKVVYNQTHSAQSVRNKPLITKIPSAGLGVDQTRSYEVTVEPVNVKHVHVRPGNGSITTKAYTASEEVIKVSNTNLPWDRVISDKWVAMTEKYLAGTYKEYFEGFSTTVDSVVEMPTGYAHGNVNTIETWTELDSDDWTSAQKLAEIPKVNGTIYADPEVADGDYAVHSDNRHIVEVTETVEKDLAGKSATSDFTLAQTYVTEGGTGEVTVTNTKPDGAVDGGNNMYIPVWLDDLGSYSYTFISDDPVGRNHISFEIEHFVDVESYMFAHSDSDTIDKDALLIQPIFDNWFANIANRDPFEVRRDYMWQADDFNYAGNAVTGFSAKGVHSYNTIPEGTARLEIPMKNPSTGETITEIKGTNTTDKGSFYNYVFIGEFVAPSVEKIGDYAFYNSEFSGQFNAPDLKSVGRYAFMDSLFSGTLNAPKLTNVGDFGFYHSTFDGNIDVTNVGTDAFYHSE